MDNKLKTGFTLIELLVVVAISGLLMTIIALNAMQLLKQPRIGIAVHTQKQMIKAVDLYLFDMGFYPPDVNRGWDPGLVRMLPWNLDIEAGNPVPPPFNSPGTNCGHCPSNWQTIVQANWRGPYLTKWPLTTPWGGKYDYNYWGSGATRYGCTVPPGIYAGVQGNYQNNNRIPPDEEQRMINELYEAEACLNGESQMLLKKL